MVMKHIGYTVWDTKRYKEARSTGDPVNPGLMYDFVGGVLTTRHQSPRFSENANRLKRYAKLDTRSVVPVYVKIDGEEDEA